MTGAGSARTRQGRKLQVKNGSYYLVPTPAGYPGYVFKGRYSYAHHVAWWERTGKQVPKGYVLHHRNGDKTDDRAENLELLSRSEHTRVHHKVATVVSATCAKCFKVFTRRERQVARNLAKGFGTYCSKRCAGYAGKQEGLTGEHGTVGAYGRCGPPTCELCREAKRKYERERRARKALS